MTNPIFTMLPIGVPNPALPVIPSASYRLLDPYERGAYGHWVFGGSASSLIDKVNGRSLTVQSDGVSYPDASFLSMSGAQGKALLTDAEETATSADTMAIVLRRTGGSGALGVPFGTLSPSTPTPTSGFSPFFAASESVWTRANGMNTGGNAGLTAPMNQWLFIATTRDFSAASRPNSLLVGGQAIYSRTDSGTFAPAASPRKISIGSAYYNSSALAAFDVAEFIYIRRAMTSTELADLYARSKARMATRGITVV